MKFKVGDIVYYVYEYTIIKVTIVNITTDKNGLTWYEMKHFLDHNYTEYTCNEDDLFDNIDEACERFKELC